MRLGRRLIAATMAVSLGLTLTSCASGSRGPKEGVSADGRAMLETNGPEVLSDPDGSGLEVSQRFFETAEAVVIADAHAQHLQVAAEKAIDLGAPLLQLTSRNADAISEEVKRLGAKKAYLSGDLTELNLADLETTPVVETTSATSTTELPAEDPHTGDQAVDLGTTVDVDTSTSEHHPTKRAAAVEHIAGLPENTDHPVALPPVFITNDSAPAAVATAKAAGAAVHLLDYPDPRLTSESMKLSTEGDTIAIGRQFGDEAHYRKAVELADNGELPGGGGLVFPGRRMIAYYGHPSGPALGVMGEQPPAEAVDKLGQLVKQYQPLDEQPVIPAFEIIVTVASSTPGPDNKYTNVFPQEDFVEYIDAITEAGGYAVLDLQPGRASFLEQAKYFEDLLKRPNVGLALDPEWRIGDDELPMQRIGNSTAEEINEVAEWLADFVNEHKLPQKALVIHQFQLQMVRDREQINTNHPELAFVLHADGHGTPPLKFETWNILQQDLQGEWFMAWKNFIDEDTPTFTPEQTYNDVDPRPWFVSYQ